jgi:endonuclease YncB( thermonuclease family)
MRTATPTTRPPFLELADCRAIDGDSIDARVLLPLGVSTRRRIRLKGFFAPELTGAMRSQAKYAQMRLQSALDVCACYIATHAIKEDRYGRLVATLWLDGEIANPAHVLGSGQLSEEGHRADLATARA